MNLRKTLAAAAIAAGAIGVAGLPASAAHGAGDLTIGLNGANEVGTQGAKNGSGSIELSFFTPSSAPAVPADLQNEYYICFDLEYRNVEGDPVGLHIHEVDGNTKNPRKDTGAPVVFFDANATEGCTVVSEDIFDGILDDPREYYVNFHTNVYPAGAIRGQLHSFS